MAISKKLRFDVFKRDYFKCQYCGKTPPNVTLEVDHIHPKSKNGSDDINNLITACFDCNRGKRDNFLDSIPKTLQDNFNILKEKELQYKAYQKLLLNVEKIINNEINEVSLIFEKYYKTKSIAEKFKQTTIKLFIKKLNIFDVKEAMEIACNKFYYKSDYVNKTDEEIKRDLKKYQYTSTDKKSKLTQADFTIKYFCGICWSKIKENSNGKY